MKRCVTLLCLAVSIGSLLCALPAQARDHRQHRQPTCAWRRYVELYRTPASSRYGFKLLDRWQREALEDVCVMARFAIHRHHLPYRFRIDCHRYDDDTWMCVGRMRPIHPQTPDGSYLIHATIPARPYPSSFTKNIQGLLEFIHEWSS